MARLWEAQRALSAVSPHDTRLDAAHGEDAYRRFVDSREDDAAIDDRFTAFGFGACDRCVLGWDSRLGLLSERGRARRHCSDQQKRAQTAHGARPLTIDPSRATAVERLA
jgi:hypothetical protein